MTAASQDGSPIATGGEPGVHGVRGLLSLWFGVRRDVGRGAYLASGLSLMALKYVLERGIIQATTGRVMSPSEFLTPSLAAHETLLRGAPELAAWLLVTLSFPFLWIAVSMSVRRAGHAGLSPWLGLLVLVPLLNLLVMLVLAALPERPGLIDAEPSRGAPVVSAQRARLLGLLAGLAAGFVVLLITVLGLKSYAFAMFVGMPVVMGAVAVGIASRAGSLSLRAAIGQGALVALLGGIALLLFALEGAGCIAMALPLALPLGMLGGAIGKRLADSAARVAGAVTAVLMLPVFAGIEALGTRALDRPPPLHEVLTSVIIDAPPERVWPLVIAFPELPPPTSWIFRHGIAYPTDAHIDGAGVGAIRRCEFSTGAFVEPITAWEPPCRLAFDVTSQPLPLVEWSPWGPIDVPHLHDYLRSRRGEFRLLAQPGGRTRLEGRTWYELDMEPLTYWHLWSDALIHRIHQRVLDHVKVLAEARR